MKQAQQGDRVSFHFIGRLTDGTIVDSTYDEEDFETDPEFEPGPMNLQIGSGDFFTTIEEALIGMSPGDDKTVTLVAKEVFGDYDPEKVFTLSNEQIPDDFTPEVGDLLELNAEDSDDVEVVKVLAVGDNEITFDGNHPYAGQDLICEIHLEAILED